MEMFLTAPQTYESVQWRGLLVTLLALGVLALFALLRWNGNHVMNCKDNSGSWMCHLWWIVLN